jgi:hypothetical protein
MTGFEVSGFVRINKNFITCCTIAFIKNKCKILSTVLVDYLWISPVISNKSYGIIVLSALCSNFDHYKCLMKTIYYQGPCFFLQSFRAGVQFWALFIHSKIKKHNILCSINFLKKKVRALQLIKSNYEAGKKRRGITKKEGTFQNSYLPFSTSNEVLEP